MKSFFFILLSILLLASGGGVWWAFTTPAERERQVRLLSYEHDGTFEHQVYAKGSILNPPAADEESKPVFFTRLIDSMDMTFSYRFLCDEPVTNVREWVTVSAVLESAGMWQYEVILIPETRETGNFTIDFPLEYGQFDEVIQQLRDETGVGAASPEVTFKVSVHTLAQTALGAIEDDFIHTTKVRMTPTTVEWPEDLAVSERGLYLGMKYEHQGIFDYIVRLKPNLLFGAGVIRSGTPPPEPPVAMAKSSEYPRNNIDSMDVTFSYEFRSDEPVEQVTEEIEITAELKDPENWSESFVLVHKGKHANPYTVTVPLDLPYFYKMIAAKQEEMRVFASSHDLVLKAEVHTVAETAFGRVDEVYAKTLDMRLTENSVGWPEENGEPQPGSIEETTIVTQPEVETARRWSLPALGVFLVAFLYVLWDYSRPVRISAVEAEALQAKKKHKDVIVDVQQFPEAKAEDTVIQLSSLGELIKTADALFKPVLHFALGDRHVYCVMDGLARYEYISELQPPDEEDLALG